MERRHSPAARRPARRRLPGRRGDVQPGRRDAGRRRPRRHRAALGRGHRSGDRRPARGRSGPASSLAFSPDGATLAVGSYDGTIRLWDLATRQPIGVPYLPGVPVSALAFGPDGATLIAASTDGTIWRRDVAFLADPVSSLCQAAGRPLSRAEWTRYVQGPAYQDICP